MGKILSRFASIAVMLAVFISVIPLFAYAEGEDSPNITVTDFTKPEGKLETGQFFVLKGIITSEEPIKVSIQAYKNVNGKKVYGEKVSKKVKYYM